MARLRSNATPYLRSVFLRGCFGCSNALSDPRGSDASQIAQHKTDRYALGPHLRTIRNAEGMETSRTLIEFGVWATEAIAVLVIVGAFLWATVRFVLQTRRHDSKPYEKFKLSLGRALSLGLEFLVAADVIRTVTMTPTLGNIAILAGIILTRTFLSWSLVVEMEGRWPWQPQSIPRPEVTT
jgi:uncharacterized membrane protein